MVSTKVFIAYLMILIFFSFFSGLFNLNQATDTENDIILKKTLFTNDIKNKILVNTGLGDFAVFQVTANILALPFIILESLIFIISIIGIGFITLPSALQILFFAPMGIIIILDYVIPAIRGN